MALDLQKLAGITSGKKLIIKLSDDNTKILSMTLNGVEVKAADYKDYVNVSDNAGTLNSSTNLELKAAVKGFNIVVDSKGDVALTVDAKTNVAAEGAASIEVNNGETNAVTIEIATTATTVIGSPTLLDTGLTLDTTKAGIYYGTQSKKPLDLKTTAATPAKIITDMAVEKFTDAKTGGNVNLADAKVVIGATNALTLKESAAPVVLMSNGKKYLYFATGSTPQTFTPDFSNTYKGYTLEQCLFVSGGASKIDLSNLTSGQKLDVLNSANVYGIKEVKGTNYNDTLTGVTLDGGKGNDYLTAGDSEAASLKGGDGNDTLVAGSKNDILDGGDGNDTFVFGADSGSNVIHNFDITKDTIKLAGSKVADIKLDTTVNKIKFDKTDVTIYSDTGTTPGISSANKFTVEGTDGKKIIKVADSGSPIIYENGVDVYLTLDDKATMNVSALSGNKSIWLGNASSDIKVDKVASINGAGADGSLNMRGDTNDNELIGGNIADEIWGNAGDNTLTGNGGADTFWLGVKEKTTITDYTYSDKDKIKLYDYDFTAKTLNMVNDGSNNVNITVGDDTIATLQNIPFAADKGAIIVEDKNGEKKTIQVSDSLNGATYDQSTAIYYLSNTATLKGSAISSEDLWLGRQDLGTKTIYGGKDLNFVGSSADLYLHGDTQANSITGGNGNDQLWGGADGANTLTGGNGNDQFWFGFEAGTTTVADLGVGDDTIVLYDTALKDVKVAAGTGNVQLSVDGKLGILELTGADVDGKTFDILTTADGKTTKVKYTNVTNVSYGDGINAYYSTNGTTTLDVVNNAAPADIWLEASKGVTNIDASKSTVTNYLHGTTGNNNITGGSGNDEIWGGAGGNNNLRGGDGADTFYVTNEGNQVTRILDGTNLDSVLFYNTGLTDLSNVSANVSGTDLVISLSDTTLEVAGWSKDKLNTFKLGDASGISAVYEYDAEAGKLVKK